MNDKVVIAGTVKLRNTIKAKTNLHNTINGTPSWVVNTGGGGIVYPHYTGSYTVTPSGSVQTLDTSDKVLDDDVTIQAMPQGSATTPATIITADPTISVSSGGLITATVSKTQQITPTVQEGYVSVGTAGNVGVSGSNTQQLTVQSAQTIHPASTDQTIASGKYLTGTQTFKAVTVTGLTADKVLQGNTVKIGDADDDDRIMSVTGTASGGITPTGTKQITANGTNIDVYNYQYADVAVPNSYSAGDEGKVVSNGALVAQTSDTVTANDTYDTTLINSLTVNVSGGGGISVDGIATGVEPSGSITITASSIVGQAFRNNTGITGVTGNNLTVIAGSAFQSCTNMTSASFPNVTQIGDDGFNGCTKLVSIDVRKLVKFSTKRGFSGCSKLTTFVGGLTKLTTISDQCFYNTRVPVFVFPAITSGTGSANCFGGNTALTTCDFGVRLSSVGATAFSGATSFTTLIIRKASVVSLSNINAFTNTPFASGKTGGTLYVPSALISSYQSASNWSTILGYSTNSIQAIEGSQYENYYADGTPISS